MGEVDLARPNLAGANLYHADLADLTGANFSHAHLANASLAGGDLGQHHLPRQQPAPRAVPDLKPTSPVAPRPIGGGRARW
ncbi:MAG: hypothetical protein QOK40_1912 [Miltoncostaeaceae bacterium]|jgi:uncharacterized protein YjbI with pentapeptide repeats|nr:hypothetical protein [Miltoncostaeaceae bacterium]